MGVLGVVASSAPGHEPFEGRAGSPMWSHKFTGLPIGTALSADANCMGGHQTEPVQDNCDHETGNY